MSAFDENPVA